MKIHFSKASARRYIEMFNRPNREKGLQIVAQKLIHTPPSIAGDIVISVTLEEGLLVNRWAEGDVRFS